MNIGLVLSGGMAKGAYQIGALKALSDFIPKNEIKYISCASIGTLNGYAFAAEKLDLAEKMWKSVCSDGTRLFINKALKSSMLQQKIADLCEPVKPLQSLFYCSLFDFTHRKIVYKELSSVNDDQILPWLKASVAMPVYNKAVRIDNTSYFDGAMIDNIPVYPLLKCDLDYIICVYFDDTCFKFENTFFDNKIIKITFPYESGIKPSVVCRHEDIEEMITRGYERTVFLLKQFFSEGYDNLKHIYAAVEMENRYNKRNLRITGDVIVTNLNKITQRIVKKKIY